MPEAEDWQPGVFGLAGGFQRIEDVVGNGTRHILHN